MEAKVGMMQKLRRMFSGTPQETHVQQAPAAAEPKMSAEETVQDQARQLCSDAWLANRITVKAEQRDGKTYLVASPAEAAPYVRAAYEAKKAKLPADVLLA